MLSGGETSIFHRGLWKCFEASSIPQLIDKLSGHWFTACWCANKVKQRTSQGSTIKPAVSGSYGNFCRHPSSVSDCILFKALDAKSHSLRGVFGRAWEESFFCSSCCCFEFPAQHRALKQAGCSASVSPSIPRSSGFSPLALLHLIFFETVSC